MTSSSSSSSSRALGARALVRTLLLAVPVAGVLVAIELDDAPDANIGLGLLVLLAPVVVGALGGALDAWRGARARVLAVTWSPGAAVAAALPLVVGAVRYGDRGAADPDVLLGDLLRVALPQAAVTLVAVALGALAGALGRRLGASVAGR